MTNLGAGFSVGSPETTGPPPPSSSGPASERDRYREFCYSCLHFINEKPVQMSARISHSFRRSYLHCLFFRFPVGS